MIFKFFYLTTLVSICLAAGAFDTKLQLKPPEGQYKIMMLLPFASESHRNCFLPLAETLAERGHKVYIISPLPPKSKHPNVKEINHNVKLPLEELNMFDIRANDPTLGFGSFKETLPLLAREMYKDPTIWELYTKRNEFDTFILDELFNEVAFPFLEGRNYMTISTAGIMIPSSASMGNVLNPSFIPGMIFDFPRPYTFWNRVVNLFTHLYVPYYWRHYEMFPLLHKELRHTFPNLSSFEDIEKGLSLVLANTHFSMDASIPLLPSQVEVGGMHCKPGKKLPEDLQKFIDDSGSKGVIYFSLGSVCKGKTIPEKSRKILLEGFSKMKRRVIWKFEEEFKDLPKNILIKKWLPQQDILAHPKIKLFITHGGLLSMQESIFHGKPLLAMPVFGDQERNSLRIFNKGFGNFLMWENLTVDNFISAVNEVLDNPKYLESVKEVSKSFRDQPQHPLERAVWWTEYVIRHKGAPQLKSPGASISWIEYLMVDIAVVIHVTLFSTFWLLKRVLSMIFKTLFNHNNQSKGKKKRE